MALTGEIMKEVEDVSGKPVEQTRNEILKEFVLNNERYIADFAKKIGTNPNYLRQVLNGNKPVSNNLINQIAKVYPNVTHYLKPEYENIGLLNRTVGIPATSIFDISVYSSKVMSGLRERQEMTDRLTKMQHQISVLQVEISKMIVRMQEMNDEDAELLGR